MSSRRVIAVIVAASVSGTACNAEVALLGRYRSSGRVGTGGVAGESSSNGGTATSTSSSSRSVGGSGGGSTFASNGGRTSETTAATTIRRFPQFGEPHAIAGLDAPGFVNTDPSVTGDGLELYFMSNRPDNDPDIFRITRASESEPWSAPLLVSELSSDAVERNVRVSPDGLRIWFYSDRQDKALGTIWQATRASVTDPFSTPIPVPGMSEGYGSGSYVSACASGDGSIAIVSVAIDNVTGGYDLFEKRRVDSRYANATSERLQKVNSAEHDYDPWLSHDGLVLVFHSNRTGAERLFWASRATVADSFGEATPLTEFFAAGDTEAPSLNQARNLIWFSATVDGDTTIYEAAAVQ